MTNLKTLTKNNMTEEQLQVETIELAKDNAYHKALNHFWEAILRKEKEGLIMNHEELFVIYENLMRNNYEKSL